MPALTTVKRTLYKTVFKKLLERFAAVEKRVGALEKSVSNVKKSLASANKNLVAVSKAPDSETATLGIQLAQLTTLLELKGAVPPIPPGHLQLRVSGAHSPQFFSQGADLLRGIERLVEAQGRSLESFESVLDFGCGCGRILIPLMVRVGGRHLHGCDIDAEAIDWCKAKLTDCAGFAVNNPLPPMAFADNQFDLIFGVSVFTHLPEQMQFKWLDDLFRVTKPGGYAIMTFHGEPHYQALHPAHRAKLDAHGFFYSDAPQGSTAGLPDFYQTSWHTHEYVRKHWGAKFEVIDIVEGAIANHSAAVMRKPT